MAILGYSDTFLDLIHLLEGVNCSNLFLRRPNTSVDAVEGLEEARSDKSRYKSLPGRPENMILAQNSAF